MSMGAGVGIHTQQWVSGERGREDGGKELGRERREEKDEPGGECRGLSVDL